MFSSWFPTWFPIWLEITDIAIRVVLGLYVVYRRRPVAVTLAWLVIIAFLPIVAVFVYLMVGDTPLGVRRARQYEAFTKDLERQALALWKERGWETETGTDHARLARFGTKVWGLPPMRGNRLRLLRDNNTMLDSLVADIDGAKDHVHMVFYIWVEDTCGRRVGEALMRAKARGVECRVLVDGVGSWAFINGPLWNQMRGAGVQLLEALRVNWIRRPFARLDLRNHRKITVVDGRIGYCGSQNIHDTGFKSPRWKRAGRWVDASVRVEGPSAQALGVTFLRDWQLDSDETITDIVRYLPPIEVDAAKGRLVQVVPSGPGPTPQAIHQALLTLIYSAETDLVMTTPYFVPDEALLSALVAAATRGVKVRLVMPRASDSMIVAIASRSYYVDLLAAGVRIWHYTGGLLHAKVMSVDGNVAMVGSTNMDARSFFLNFEITLFVYDTAFTADLRALQMHYLESSHEVLLDRWRKRRWWVTLRDNAVQLLGPLL